LFPDDQVRRVARELAAFSVNWGKQVIEAVTYYSASCFLGVERHAFCTLRFGCRVGFLWIAAMGRTAGSLAIPRMAGIGASRPLWRIPAIVSFLNPHPALSLVAGNRSSCPIVGEARFDLPARRSLSQYNGAAPIQANKFVATKSIDRLDLQALHHVRERLVSQRTGIINQIRAFLLERGVAVRQRPRFLRIELPRLLTGPSDVV